MSTINRKILIFRDGRASLPLSIEDVRAMLASGECREQDLAQWLDGDEWLPLVVLLKEADQPPAPRTPESEETFHEDSGDSPLGLIGLGMVGLMLCGVAYWLWINGLTGINTGGQSAGIVATPVVKTPAEIPTTNAAPPAEVAATTSTESGQTAPATEDSGATSASASSTPTPMPPQVPVSNRVPRVPGPTASAGNDALLAQVALALEESRLPEAQELLSRAELNGANRKEVYVLKAALYRRSENEADELKALRMVNTLSRMDSSYAPAHLLRTAQLLLKRSEERPTTSGKFSNIAAYSEARMSLTKYVELEPDSLDGHILLGLCEMGMRSWTEATRQYELALKLEPDNPEVLSALLALAIRKKDTARVLQLSQDLRLISPELYAPYSSKAALLVAEKIREREAATADMSYEYKETLRRRYNLTNVLAGSEVPRSLRGLIYCGGTLADDGTVKAMSTDIIFGSLASSTIRLNEKNVDIEAVHFATAYRGGEKVAYVILTLPAGLMVFRDSGSRRYPLVMELLPDSGKVLTSYFVYIQ